MPKNNKSMREPAFPKGIAQPAVRALASIGVTQLAQVTNHREADLAKLHGMGPKALGALKAALAESGLSFADKERSDSKSLLTGKGENMPKKDYPRVGVAVIIERDEKVLLVKRKNAHGAGTWAVPGGHLEFGETAEECAVRETREEVGVAISGIRFAALTNDIFPEEGKHYITIWMQAASSDGEPCIAARREVGDVGWFNWKDLPAPLFLPLQNLLDGKGYPDGVRFFERRKHGRKDPDEF